MVLQTPVFVLSDLDLGDKNNCDVRPVPVPTRPRRPGSLDEESIPALSGSVGRYRLA